MKRILVILVVLFGLTGCFKRTPTTYAYTKFTPPTEAEGKKCIMECEKIKLMKLQIAEQKYTANRIDDRRNNWSATDSATKDLDELFAEIEYEKCYRNCGGKTEKATGSY